MEISALDTTQLDYGTVKEQFKSDLFYSQHSSLTNRNYCNFAVTLFLRQLE